MPLRVLSTLLLLYGLLSAPARALDPAKSFHHYVRDSWSVQEGMPQISAVAIAQDPEGYIWIATQAGLSRFDGVGFTTRSPETDEALPHPVATAIVADAAGALWIGTRGGMAVLRAGRFHAVPWGGDGDEPWIYGLHLDEDGQVWAATSSGVGHVEQDRLRPLPPRGAAYSVLRAGGVVWAGGVDGVHRWDGTAWSSTRWPTGGPPIVRDLLLVGDEVWAASTGGLYAHGEGGWREVPGAAGEGALPLHFVQRDSDGNFWAGGDLGLVRIRPDGSIETIPGTPANGLFNLFGAFEDREGNLWLGSMSNGLTRVWNGWTRRYSTQDGLPDATAWSLVPDADGDGIWVGTNNGLARLGADGTFVRPPVGLQSLAAAVRTLHSEPGRLWIGLRGGLALYEPGTGRPAHTPAWARDIRTAVTGFVRGPDGGLWITTPDAVLLNRGATVERFDAGRGLDGQLAEFTITREGRRLALTTRTLLELEDGRFVTTPEGRALPDGVQLRTVTQLADGRLLASGVGALLLLWQDGQWHRLDEQAGLLPGTPYQILEHAGFLWVSSMHGVYQLAIADMDAFVAGAAGRVAPTMLLNERGMPNGGQQGLCCNGSGAAEGFLQHDTLWLPTRDGVVALDIGAITRNPLPPEVHAGPLRVDGMPRDPRTLVTGERDLSLAFNVLSYQDPRSNRAHYRLVGYDQQWHTAPSLSREVRYTNLPPGDYVFEVRGSNNADVWAPAATLAFAIRPWFHETMAFRVLLGAFALLLVHGGYRYQRYRYRVRKLELLALVDERTAELALSNRQLEQASLTDPLTGLRNRRYLARQVPADLDYYRRQLSIPPSTDDVVVFAMLDVDHFKQVNDRHGHAAGDRVLEEIARRLQTMVRSGDYVVRWGGEEFLMVFRPMPGGQVSQLADRLVAAVSGAPFDIGEDRSIALTASLGLSEYPLFQTPGGRPLGWEAMAELADQALYFVKRNGRDGWALFRPTPSTRLASLIPDLQQDATALLDAGELTLLCSRTRAPPGAR